MIRNQTIVEFGEGQIGCAQGPSSPGVYMVTFRTLNEALPVGDIPEDQCHVFDQAEGNSEVALTFKKLASLKLVAEGFARAVEYFEKQLAREAEE